MKSETERNVKRLAVSRQVLLAFTVRVVSKTNRRPYGRAHRSH